MSLQFEISWNWSEESDELRQILPLLTKLRTCTNIVSLIVNLWSYYPSEYVVYLVSIDKKKNNWENWRWDRQQTAKLKVKKSLENRDNGKKEKYSCFQNKSRTQKQDYFSFSCSLCSLFSFFSFSLSFFQFTDVLNFLHIIRESF